MSTLISTLQYCVAFIAALEPYLHWRKSHSPCIVYHSFGSRVYSVLCFDTNVTFRFDSMAFNGMPNESSFSQCIAYSTLHVARASKCRFGSIWWNFSHRMSVSQSEVCSLFLLLSKVNSTGGIELGALKIGRRNRNKLRSSAAKCKSGKPVKRTLFVWWSAWSKASETFKIFQYLNSTSDRTFEFYTTLSWNIRLRAYNEWRCFYDVCVS